MHYLFLIPLIGGALLVLLQLMVKGFSRLSLNLWNSEWLRSQPEPSTEGLLTSLVDLLQWINPYYYIGVAFLALAPISLFFVRSVWVEKTA